MKIIPRVRLQHEAIELLFNGLDGHGKQSEAVGSDVMLPKNLSGRDNEPASKSWPPKLPDTVWTGLVQQFVDIVGPCTEAPAEYHLGSFFCAVGVIIGRRCWVSYPQPTFANFYSLLIGETGDARKTTAYRFGVKLLEEVAERLQTKVKRLYGISSVEGLAAAMKDGDSAEAFRILDLEDEFRSLITKGHQKGTSNVIPRLTELYNALSTFEVNTKERVLIDNPYLSILGSSTEAWFRESLSESEISGGFLNRWTLFAGRSDRLIPFPEPPDETVWVHFVTEIARLIERASGRFGIAEDAKKLFEEFYRRFRNRRVAGSALEVTARTHVHAIKFALIYAILAGHCQIEADDIERGVALANYCAEVAEAVSASIGQSKTCAKEQRLLAALRVGRLSTRDAMRRLRCSADDLCRMTRALERLGNIAVIRERSLSGREQVFIESLD